MATISQGRRNLAYDTALDKFRAVSGTHAREF